MQSDAKKLASQKVARQFTRCCNNVFKMQCGICIVWELLYAGWLGCYSWNCLVQNPESHKSYVHIVVGAWWRWWWWCYTHTYNCFSAIWILSGTTRVSWYQKKHSPTHTYLDHPLSASSIYYDPWHPPCSIYVPDSPCSTISRSPSFLWSTSWPGTLNLILHTFLHPIIVFFLHHMLILL